MLNRIRKSVEEGFTLIELLIVIVILGILAGIVVFAVGTTGSNAKVSACQADVKTVETALEAYKAEQGAYPTNIPAAPFTATEYADLTTTHQYLKEAPPASEKITWTSAGVVSSGVTGCP